MRHTPQKDDVVCEIGRHMTAVRNLFVQIFEKMLKGDEKISEMPFTLAQLKALSAFHEDRAYSMGELSKNALVKMPSMTEMVDKLVEENILERVRDEQDRRIVKVRLTGHGKTIHNEFITRRQKELHTLFGQLNDREQQTLLKNLQQVSSLLQKIADTEKKQ